MAFKVFICVETNEVPNMGSLDAVNIRSRYHIISWRIRFLGCTLKKRR